MRRLILAACLLLASPAWGESIFQFAESAKVNPSGTCVKVPVQKSGMAYTVVRCDDGDVSGNSAFYLPFHTQPGAVTDLTTTISGQTPPGVTGTCRWLVRLCAGTSGSAVNAATCGSNQDVDVVTTAGEKRQTAANLTALQLYDLQAQAICSGTACEKKDGIAYIILNAAATTASQCDFRMLWINTATP